MKKLGRNAAMAVVVMSLIFFTACGGKSDKDAFAAFAGKWTAVTSSVYSHLVIHEDGSWELYENEGVYTSGELNYHSEDDSVWISPENNTQWSRLCIEDDGSLYIGPLGSFQFGEVSIENTSESKAESKAETEAESKAESKAESEAESKVESEAESESEVILGDDWRNSGFVVGRGLITRQNDGGAYVLVIVDENGANFYWDEPEMILYDSVSFPMTISDAREHFFDISFSDLDGDGMSDLSIGFLYDSGEYTWLCWYWIPEEGYVYQENLSVFADENNNSKKYIGFWKYPNGSILEICDNGWWNFYVDDELTQLPGGPVVYEEDAAYLMNEDGSSGGGRVYFDEDGNLIDTGTGYVLTFLGLDFSDVPNG